MELMVTQAVGRMWEHGPTFTEKSSVIYSFVALETASQHLLE